MRPSTSRPYCFTVPTTPTMVSFRFGSIHRCLPIASPSGQKRCANFSSMTTTGSAVDGMSASVKNRPLTSGILIV